MRSSAAIQRTQCDAVLVILNVLRTQQQQQQQTSLSVVVFDIITVSLPCPKENPQRFVLCMLIERERDVEGRSFRLAGGSTRDVL
jgi:hypothetical protein